MNNPFYPRTIKSYVRREGRMTLRQCSALENLWSKYGLESNAGLIDLTAIFARPAPVVLEIGFGNGLSLLAMAAANPQQHFIGIEVHRPGVGTLLADLDERGLDNVKIFCADAKEVLQYCIPDHSLSIVQIFFPDPWPKMRHRKRRLIQTEFIHLVKQKLKGGGQLQLATDWQDYATQMMTVISAVTGFTNPHGLGKFSPRLPMRPLTKYEQRGQKLGHEVWDLVFVKQ